MNIKQEGNPTAEGAKENAKPEGSENTAKVVEGQKPEDNKDYKTMFEDQKKRAERAENDRQEALNKIKELEDGKGSDVTASDDELEAIADELGIEASAVKKLHATFLKSAEGKVLPVLKEHENKAKIQQIEAEFNKVFEREVTSDKFKGLKINKDVVKEFQFKYPDRTVESIISDIYGTAAEPEAEPKESPESAEKTGLEGGGKEIDFAKADQKTINEVILKDPELKKKYFDYLDENPNNIKYSTRNNR